MSYTTFEASDFRIDKAEANGSFEVHVDVAITNTGNSEGKETLLLFIANPNDQVIRPKIELKRFGKIALLPGETKTVSFTLTDADFARFHPARQAFIADPGLYRIELRKDAETILDALEFTILTDSPAKEEMAEKILASYMPPHLTFAKADFEALLGHSIGENVRIPKRPFTTDSTLEDISVHWLGNIIRKQVVLMAAKQIASKDPAYVEMVQRSVLETPLRSIVIFSGGKISFRTMNAILDIINRHPLQAIKRLLKRG
ncbi:MAG: fibronectin type III-like domain-contianing protein [Bacillus subtilis]|nr:fibronectin type III-like domain-contianing protein [Bacillus subtilis]